jgi:2-hydroxy-6-oxonona-2,4-dienedioate hydrolase
VRTRNLHATRATDKPALVFVHGSGGHAEAYVRDATVQGQLDMLATQLLAHARAAWETA